MSAFGDAFKAARKKFESSGSSGDYIFEHPKGSGKKFTILKKGETKSGVMKKFSAPKTSLRPKLRPNQEKPLTQKQKDAIRDAQKSTKTDLSQDSSVTPKRKAKPGGTAVPPRAGVGAGRFAGKGAGKDKPKVKTGPKAEQKRRADRKSSMPDELSNAPMDSSKGRTMSDLKGEAKLRNQKPRNPRDNQAKTGMSFKDEAMLRRLARKLEQEKATKRRLKREDTKNANRIQRDSESRRRSGQTSMPTPSKPQISDSARGKLDNEYERPVRVGRDAPRGKMLADDYYDAYGSGGMAKKKGVMTYNLGGMVKSQVNNLKGKK
jgi:hypothetical protein